MRTVVRWLLRFWGQLRRLLLRWLCPRPHRYWPSPRVGGPIRRPHAPPKPQWVRDEVVRLKALMPQAGCRTLAHHFNRRWAARRQMTVGKTYVAETLRRQHYLIASVRRAIRRRRPRLLPRNLIWGLDLTGKHDGQGRPQHILGILDHASRACLALRILPDKSSRTLLGHVAAAVRRFGSPTYLRTDNEPIFTAPVFRLGLWLMGIRHQRTDPHCPWQNGRIERFFGTVKRALREEPLTSDTECADRLTGIRQWYNHHRPHDHLHGRTPAEVWAGVDVFAATTQGRRWLRQWQRHEDRIIEHVLPSDG